jgi:hypothetical protein
MVLERVQGHTINVGFVADGLLARSGSTGNTIIGSEIFMPGIALMLNPCFIGVADRGVVRSTYAIAATDGMRVLVERDAEGLIRFTVGSQRLPDAILCGDVPLRVGVSLTARGQDVSFPADTNVDASRLSDVSGDLTPSRLPFPDSVYFENLDFLPNLPSVTLGGDPRTVRCLERPHHHRCPGVEFPGPTSSGCVRTESQQVLRAPEHKFGVTIATRRCCSPFGIAFRSIEHEFEVGVWIAPGKRDKQVTLQLWDTRADQPEAEPRTVDHGSNLVVMTGATSTLSGTGTIIVTRVIHAIALRFPHVSVPASSFRAALIFTAPQSVFVGVRAPDLAEAEETARMDAQ